MTRQTICLCMIVKDEAHVIERCLASVRPLIDTWVIVDTGSSDETQELVRTVLSDVPGELYERPWRDFAHNRTEALELARGRADYVLVIDADEVLEIDPDFQLPELTADAYTMEVAFHGTNYLRRALVRDALAWRYVGVLHEYLHCDEARTEEDLLGIRTVPRHDGARARDPNTYRRDVLLLEQALIDEPDNARYVFYLAQSYRDAGDLESALRHYRRRAEMPGWADEAWFSLYQIAQIQDRLERPWGEVLESYLEAYERQPDRAGPLFHVGLHYQREGKHHVAHAFFSRAMGIPMPQGNRLFVERPLYEYVLPVEYAVAAFYVGDHVAAVETNNALLRDGRLPSESVAQIVRNRRFSLDVRHPKKDGDPPGRLRVVLIARDPGPELEAAIDGVLAQEDVELEAVVVDDGSRELVEARVPTDPRLRVIRHDQPVGDAAALEALANEGWAANDVIVALAQGQGLATRGTLSAIRAAFADAGCELLYGPHRARDGRVGPAFPAASAAEHDATGDALAGEAALCFRAATYERARKDVMSPGRPDLWRAASFAGTRFSDDALTVETGFPAATASDARSRPVVAPTNGNRPPLISCLMITRDRLSLAMRAMKCFADQTYPERELVVVSEGSDWYRRALARYADAEGISNVRIVPAEPGLTLGALRNISLEEATGEIVCQWDDDDCSHPDRLAEQASAMGARNADACFLTDHLQYLEHEQLLFWIDWTMDGQIADEVQLFPGTVMMRRDVPFRYPEEGPYSSRGEDSVLVAYLNRFVSIARIPGMGHLYLYHYHGRNTFPREHHHHIAACAAATEKVQAKEADIRAAVEYYPVPKPIPVLGKDGPAFIAG